MPIRWKMKDELLKSNLERSDLMIFKTKFTLLIKRTLESTSSGKNSMIEMIAKS